MKSFLTHFLCFGLGVAALLAFQRYQNRPARTVKESALLLELGIRPGDLLLSVNGVADQNMFDVMADGFKKGDVCVVFERESRKREVCLKRS